MSYASAFHEARLQYEERGASLDAITFANIIKQTPTLIGKLLQGVSMFNDGVTSGALGRGRATVIMPGDGYSTNIGQMDMTNYNRDQRVAGSTAMGIGSLQNGMIDPFNPNAMPTHNIPDMVDLDNLSDDDDEGYAEEIDLANDGGEDSGGGVRRLG